MDTWILQAVIFIGGMLLIWQGLLIGKLREDIRALCKWAYLVEETLDTQSRDKD